MSCKGAPAISATAISALPASERAIVILTPCKEDCAERPPCARLARTRARGRPAERMCYERSDPDLEDIAELEVHLPTRVGLPEAVDLIEAVAEVESEWSKRGHNCHPDAGTAEQPSRVKVGRRRVQIAGIEEQICVDRAIQSESQLSGRDHKSI